VSLVFAQIDHDPASETMPFKRFSRRQFAKIAGWSALAMRCCRLDPQ
jgi:hypothetical protein